MLAWVGSRPKSEIMDDYPLDPLPGRDLHLWGDHWYDDHWRDDYWDYEIDLAIRNPPGDPIHDHYFPRK